WPTTGFPSRKSFTPGQNSASPSDTQGGSRMPELGPYGSVRGALSNERPYRDTNWNGHRFFGLRQGKIDAAGHGRDRRKGEASAGARTAQGASLGNPPPMKN